MKALISALLVLGILASPIGCIVACPDLCCPESASVSPCPFDILAVAKDSQPAHVIDAALAVAEPVVSPVIAGPAVSIFTPVAADGRDLHLSIRILRI
jgi:hypothetical protein